MFHLFLPLGSSWTWCKAVILFFFSYIKTVVASLLYVLYTLHIGKIYNYDMNQLKILCRKKNLRFIHTKREKKYCKRRCNNKIACVTLWRTKYISYHGSYFPIAIARDSMTVDIIALATEHISVCPWKLCSTIGWAPFFILILYITIFSWGMRKLSGNARYVVCTFGHRCQIPRAYYIYFRWLFLFPLLSNYFKSKINSKQCKQ